jgi:hypothetical protein
MHRPTVLFLTVVMALGAAALWIWPIESDDAMWASLHGALVRMGIILACLWLAEPQLRRIPPWMVLVFIVGAVLILASLKQPALYRLAIPVLVILWVTRRVPPPKRAATRA